MQTQSFQTTPNQRSPQIKKISIGKDLDNLKWRSTMSPEIRSLRSLSFRFQSLLPKLRRRKLKELLQKNPYLEKLYFCTSKYKFQKILFKLPEHLKLLVRKYMEEWFVLHVHLRPINDIWQLLSQRGVITRPFWTRIFLTEINALQIIWLRIFLQWNGLISPDFPSGVEECRFSA